ncbi:MAG: nitroreductase family protein [Bacteroidales bacterium]|nr:nitroreductase family protein [Bacteroidales bacterium]MCF8387500.1 nitroreductase family protein [Bacteroidales bacterium]MCF8399135.1 nitroreductase family protein [Bacteroidales bacterium]
MKNFLELVNDRQSVRRYTDKAVEKEKLELCLEAARLAPSASNSQPWHFIVVDDSELKDKVAHHTYDPLISFNKFVPQAPILVVIVLEKPKVITQIGDVIKKKKYPVIDMGVVAEHFCLQAAELGLGTCMLGWFNQKPIQKLLNIPEKREIGLIITLGYPPEDYKLRKKIRKDINEIVTYNTYK